MMAGNLAFKVVLRCKYIINKDFHVFTQALAQ